MTLPLPSDLLRSEVEARFGLSSYSDVAFARAVRAVERADGDLEERCAVLLALSWAEREGRLLAVAEELAVGETHFFRDAPQLSSLVDLLAARALPRTRVWSVGCSTGEEPYTIAMLLERRGLLERFELFGSDLRRGALAMAEAALYREWSFRSTPLDVQRRWFLPTNGAFALDDRLRRSVRFEAMNLLDVGAGPRWDAIVCRNVLLYFRPARANQAVACLAARLRPGGFLVLDPTTRGFVEVPSSLRPTGAGQILEAVPARATETEAHVRPPAARPTPPPILRPIPKPTRDAQEPSGGGAFDAEIAAAIEALRAQDLDGAALACVRARAHRPSATLPYLVEGDVALARGDARSARAAFRAGVFLEPDGPHGRLGLAQSLALLGDAEGARGHLTRALAAGTLTGELRLRALALRTALAAAPERTP